MNTPSHDTSLPFQIRNLGLAVAASLLILLAGCAAPNTGSAPQATAPLPEQYRTWFDGGQPVNLEWSHKQTARKADEAAAAGNPRGAIRLLTSLADQGFPQAHYELGKLFDQGEVTARDPVRAARHYAEAVSTPSYILGHASLNLAKLYRAGDGVERNDLLAYYLLRQALDEEVGRDAKLMLAELLAKGGEGVRANPERAAALYAEAAEEGQEEAFGALAKAYSPGGWLDERPERAMDYAWRYAEALRKRAAAGEADAMRRLADLHAPDGLLGDQPEQRLHWLRQAAEAGDEDALGDAGSALLDAGKTRQGIAVLEEAAGNGDVDAMAKLGGALIDTRPGEARRWLDRAVAQGSTDARVSLGRLLIEGGERVADPRRGVALLEEAARQDDPLALALLGDFYMGDELAPSQPLIAVDYLRRGHELGHPWATQLLGEAYLKGRGVPRDPQRAEALLREAADRGQGGALGLLGQAYLEGEVLPFHPSRGEQLLQAAADAGETSAMTALGEAYLTGPLEARPERGVQLLRRAAQQGDSYAMVVLGRAYRKGEGGLPRDLDRATRWLTRAQEAGHASADAALTRVNRDLGAQGDIRALIEAAEDGHPGAMADLGRAFLEGQGVQQNREHARTWLTRAAQAGHSGARAELGEMLLDSDPERAIALLRSAADDGHQGARLTLGRAYLEGEYVAAAPEQGIAYLRPAAEAGNPHAAQLLGQAYLAGSGVEADPQKAEEWLNRAVESGDVSARANLGRVLLRGESGVPRDGERGLALLQKAADEGHPGAMATLGREYIRGEYLEQDARRGADYLLQAAQQQHPSARLALAKAYLAASGLENASREQALLWLDDVIQGDSDMALQTLHELLSGDEAIRALQAESQATAD